MSETNSPGRCSAGLSSPRLPASGADAVDGSQSTRVRLPVPTAVCANRHHLIAADGSGSATSSKHHCCCEGDEDRSQLVAPPPRLAESTHAFRFSECCTLYTAYSSVFWHWRAYPRTLDWNMLPTIRIGKLTKQYADACNFLLSAELSGRVQIIFARTMIAGNWPV